MNMTILKTTVVFALTFGYCIWISVVVNQHNYFLVLTCFLVVLGALYLLLRTTFLSNSWAYFGGAGAVSGYLSFIAAAAITQCAEREGACIARDITGNLYYAPLFSLGWIYGAVVFALLGSSRWNRRQGNT
jgi:hypothetical protein